ncbi:hypothetical protein GF360_02385 [candidate division WWE3 bacterium]|nr:hypothetical protein [candidate division WWE3 bacterium]
MPTPKWLKDKKSILQKFRSVGVAGTLTPILALGMFVDIFLLEKDANLLVAFLLIIVLILMRSLSLGWEFFMKVGLGFLATFPFFVWIDAWAIAEKMAVWCYLSLFISCVKLLVRVREENSC